MKASSRLYAFQLARRELRGGLSGLRVFLGCIVLGVAAIAGIGSLAASLGAGIIGNARELLGGDVEARLSYRPADAAEHAFLARSGALSEIATLRAMARTQDGARQSLIELKAVDPAYPLYGRIGLSPPQSLGAALSRRDGVFGAVVDPAILDRLGVELGGYIRIGEAALQLRGTIVREPDAASSGLILGPRVMIAAAALPQTRLIQPGALVTYDYRLRLPPGADAVAWAAAARTAFPQAGWQIRSFGEAARPLQGLLDRIALFLSLVGLTALLVGGVGISNAVRGHIAAKTTTIATLKCLGAWTRLGFHGLFHRAHGAGVDRHRWRPGAGRAVAGSGPAVTFGGASGLGPARLLPGATGLGGTLWPVDDACLLAVAARRDRVDFGRGALFRDVIERSRRRVSRTVATATALLALALAALAVASAQDRSLALWFVGGAVAAFALFRAAGAAVVLGAGKLGRPRRPLLRLALANVHRPGAPTAQIVLSLGIGLTVLVAVALVEANLAREIETRLPARAPAFFFIDIQPDQLSGFEAIVHGTPGARFDQVPMMRGRITRLNGVPVEKAAVAPEAQWALHSDRGLTYAAILPAGSRLVAGAWWPPDYHGPPLVSFDEALARGMGLKVGDTPDRQSARARDHGAHRQSACDRLGAARHQFRPRLCPGHARARAADPSCRRLSAAGRGGGSGARGDRAVSECLGDPGARCAGRGRPCRRHDRRRGSADRARHPGRRRAGARRRDRGGPSAPRLRRGGAEGAGRDPRRGRRRLPDRIRLPGRARGTRRRRARHPRRLFLS